MVIPENHERIRPEQKEPTLQDLMNLLQEIDKKLDGLLSDVHPVTPAKD